MFRALLLSGCAFICLLLSYVVCCIIYNLFFHPLRSLPGPKLWAATRMPLNQISLTGTYHKTISDLHEYYGHTVRIGPDEVSYTSAEAWKDIYAHRQGHAEFTKDPYGQVATVNGIPSIVGATRENHSRYRRLLSHAFSEKGLREQEPLIRQYVDLLIRRLHGYADEGAQNMCSWYNWTTFDLIGDLAFGESFHCLENVYNHPWIAFVHGNIKSIPFISLFRRYGLFSMVQYILPKKLLRARQENYEYAKDKVTTRVKLGKDRGDFLDSVLKYEYPKGMTTEELVSTGSSLVLAGSETTATLLSGTTYLLLKHPEVMAKLVAEIRGTFANDKAITIVSVGQLKYLSAVFEESLRFYPPVPSGLYRVTPERGDTVLGKWIPGGTVVVVQPYAAFHSPSNFHLPDSFLPERFLENNDAAFANDRRDVFQPFSTGPRNCIGRNLANVEMRLILTRVLFNFDLELDEARTGSWLDQKAFALWERPPLWVKLRPVGRD